MKQKAQKSTQKSGFFSEIIAELKKVTWPTRSEFMRLTWIVLIVAASFGVFLGLLDLGFSEIVDRLIIG